MRKSIPPVGYVLIGIFAAGAALGLGLMFTKPMEPTKKLQIVTSESLVTKMESCLDVNSSSVQNEAALDKLYRQCWNKSRITHHGM